VPKADPRVVVKLSCMGMAETWTVYISLYASREVIVVVHTPAKGRSGLALLMA
jgi:hypothetical protein